MRRTKKLEIIIRADGNSKIGMGHVYRTLNLADPLKKKGHHVTFVTKNKIVKKMIEEQFSCILLSSNLKLLKKQLKKLHCDIVIIDKKFENSQILSLLKQISKKIFGIDYVGSNKYLIDNSINILYPRSGAQNNAFSGLEYAILSGKFKTKKKLENKVRSVLVLQGGADTRCLIPQVIDSLNLVDLDFRITVVVGPSFKCWDELEKAQRNSRKFLKITQNVENMSSVMLKHDLAITAGGMTLLELSRCGIPSVIVCGEKLEEETANLMQKNGFGINLGFSKKINHSKLAKNVTKLICDYKLRKKMNRKGPQLVDGYGTSRSIKLITKMEQN